MPLRLAVQCGIWSAARCGWNNNGDVVSLSELLVSQHPTWFSLEKKSGEWRQAACESETSWKV